MRVGILSMQKVPNYGSFLQAFSLKMQMELRGCEVFFVDIEQGKQIVAPASSSAFYLLSKFDRYVLKRIANFFFARRMKKIHYEDYSRYLKHSDDINNERFDLLIIGSDEVFNATASTPWGFSPQLFGKTDCSERVVTYAASCGNTDFNSVEKYGITSQIAEAMKSISDFSVRDENTLDFVKKIIGKTAKLHIDPVFLSDFDKQIVLTKRKKPYLLVYAYSNRIFDKTEIRAIKKYAKERNLEILSVGMQQRWCSNNVCASAFELLSYLKNAQCVITDTFHGTVFSIKYNKRFAVFLRDSNKNKLWNLLSQFDLTDRLVNDPNELSKIIEKDIDYSLINSILEKKREDSYNYLDKIVSES